MVTTFSRLERALHTKCQTMTYEFKTTDPSELLVEINRLVGETNVHLHDVRVISEEDAQRVEFALCHSADLDNMLVARVLQLGRNVSPPATAR